MISGAREAIFDGENLVEPALMTCFARECGGKKDGNKITRKCLPDDASSETQDVHVVVLDGLPRALSRESGRRKRAGTRAASAALRCRE